MNKLIRTEAIVLLVLIVAVVSAYLYLFLDHHIKWALEEALTRSNGAEVNVRRLDTSLMRASLQLQDVQITNRRRPSHNVLELGRLNLDLSWPGLFKSRLILQELSLEQLAYDTAREQPGRVLEDGGALAGVFQALYSMAFEQMESQSQGTVLENVLSLLTGSDLKQQLEAFKNELESYRQARELQEQITQLTQQWQQRLEDLPTREELESIRSRLEEIRQRPSNPARIASNLQELKQIVDRLTGLQERLKEARTSFTNDLSRVQQELGSIQQAIKRDRQTLQNKFQIPSLNLEDLSRQLFMNFLERQTGSIHTLVQQARDYVPSGSGRARSGRSAAPVRAEGVNYLFRTPESLPSWWVQQSNLQALVPEGMGGGEVRLRVRDLSSNPRYVPRPALVMVSGTVPRAPVRYVHGLLKMDHRSDVPEENFRINLRDFTLRNWNFLNNPRYRFVLEEAVGQIQSRGTVRGDQLQLQLNGIFDKPRFQIDSQIDWLREVLESTVRSLDAIRFQGLADGTFSRPEWTFQSNLGEAMNNSLKTRVRDQIQQTRKQLVGEYESQIQPLLSSLQGDRGQFNDLVSGQLGPLSSQVEQLLGRASQKTGGLEDTLQQKGPLQDSKKDALDTLKDKLNF